MNSKTKNNIIIIVSVTVFVIAVIALVLVTGFSKSGRSESASNSPSDLPSDPVYSSEQSEESSELESSESTSSAESSQPVMSDDTGRQITELAVSLIGTPFAENGSTPSGFDNSGFIYYVLRKNGYLACPRSTDAQSKMGARIGRDSLKAGDLVFFGNESNASADFGGIYIGDGKMIACLMPGTSVKEVDITNSFYTANFYGGISIGG